MAELSKTARAAMKNVNTGGPKKEDPFATNEQKIAELRKQRTAKLAVNRFDFIDALIEEYDIALVQVDGGIKVKADLDKLTDVYNAEAARVIELLDKVKTLYGDIHILELKVEAAQKGTFTDGTGPWPCNADGSLKEPELTPSQALQAELEPLPNASDVQASN